MVMILMLKDFGQNFMLAKCLLSGGGENPFFVSNPVELSLCGGYVGVLALFCFWYLEKVRKI